METKIKNGRPSSPREFFRRIYGNLEKNDSNVKEGGTTSTVDVRITTSAAEIITPIPILANPIPFFLPGANEAQLTAAAAGLSAFCKVLFFLIEISYKCRFIYVKMLLIIILKIFFS